MARIEGTDWSQLTLPAPADEGEHQAMLPGVSRGQRLEQKVIITSARRELPDRVETIDMVQAESSRVLTDKTQAA